MKKFFAEAGTVALAPVLMTMTMSLLAAPERDLPAPATVPGEPRNVSDGGRIGQAVSLVVIDSNVCDWRRLAESVLPGTEVRVLDSARDGVLQISDIVAARRGITSLHIVSHGAPGAIKLGAGQLSQANLHQYTDVLEVWRKALQPTAEILLYGCDVAAGPQGAAFVHRLSSLLGAPLAASLDKTGS